MAERHRRLVQFAQRRCDQQARAMKGWRKAGKFRHSVKREVDLRGRAARRGVADLAGRPGFDIRRADEVQHRHARIERGDNKRRANDGAIAHPDARDGTVLDEDARDGGGYANVTALRLDGTGQRIDEGTHAARREMRALTLHPHGPAQHGAEARAGRIRPFTAAQCRVEGERTFQERRFKFRVEQIADAFRQQPHHFAHGGGAAPFGTPDKAAEKARHGVLVVRRRHFGEQRGDERGMRVQAREPGTVGAGIAGRGGGESGERLAGARQNEVVAVAVERDGGQVARGVA